MEKTEDKQLSWKMTFLAFAFIIAIPFIFPLGMFAYERYRVNLRWAEIVAEHEVTSLSSFNQLCSTILAAATEQQWDDIVVQWSELCVSRNKEYFEKYGR